MKLFYQKIFDPIIIVLLLINILMLLVNFHHEHLVLFYSVLVLWISMVVSKLIVTFFTYQMKKMKLKDITKTVNLLDHLLSVSEKLDNRLIKLKNDNNLESNSQELDYLQTIKNKYSVLYLAVIDLLSHNYKTSVQNLDISNNKKSRWLFTKIIQLIRWVKSKYDALSLIDKRILQISVFMYILSVILGHMNLNGFIPLVLWVASLGMLLYLIIKPNKEDLKNIKIFTTRKEVILFLLVMLVGIFFRFYKWDVIPFGLWLDEIDVARRAVHFIVENNFSEGLFQVSPMIKNDWVVYNHLYIYYIIFLFKLFGLSLFSIKLISILPSIGCIVGSYFLFRFASKNYYVALIATLLLSVSHWAITIDRWGWNEVFMTMLQVFAYLYVLLGVQKNSKNYFIVAGILLGLSFYTYVGSNMIFFIVISFFVLLSLFDFKSAKTNFINLFIIFISAFIIIFPALINYVIKPSSYFVRINEVSIISKMIDQKSINPIVESTMNHLKMFHIKGDINNRHNTESSPQLDFISGILFLIGLFVSLWKFKEPYVKLFYLWLGLGLCCGILSTTEGPQAYRTAMIVPVVMFFTAIGFKVLYDLISRILHRYVSVSIGAMCLFVIIYLNFNLYFNIRPASSECYYSSLNPNDIIIANELKDVIHNNPDKSIILDSNLVLKSYTTDLINQDLSGKKRYERFDNKSYHFFNISKEPFIMLLGAKDYNLFNLLFKDTDIKEVKNRFDDTLLYVAKVNNADQQDYKKISLFPGNEKTNICGSFVNTISSNENPEEAKLFRNNIALKRTKEDINVIINGKSVFDKGKNIARVYIPVDRISQIQIIGPYTPDEIFNNLWIKNISEETFNKLLTQITIINYTDSIGLTASYYDNSTWSGDPVIQRVIQNFDNPLDEKFNYSIKYEGYYKIHTTGMYNFKARYENEFHLYIDDEEILNPELDHNNIELKEGLHKLVLKINNYSKPSGVDVFSKMESERDTNILNFYDLYTNKDIDFCKID